jgi:hypothetical protein
MTEVRLNSLNLSTSSRSYGKASGIRRQASVGWDKRACERRPTIEPAWLVGRREPRLAGPTLQAGQFWIFDFGFWIGSIQNPKSKIRNHRGGIP